jgi:hypothetical protein
LPNPSKYRAANPCPHNLAPPHRGHREGFNHGNFFPLSNKTFTSTARCSIKMPLSERVTIGNGGQTNQPLVALFLYDHYDQISLIKTLSHTKHRDKKILPSVNLMCDVTRLLRLESPGLKTKLFCLASSLPLFSKCIKNTNYSYTPHPITDPLFENCEI